MQDNWQVNQIEYAGFAIRLVAALLDTLLYSLISLPILLWIYDDYWVSDKFILGGWDFLLTWIMPFVGTVIFWIYRSATPGKIMLKLKVLDADTGKPLSAGKAIIRYLAYFISAIPLCLGYIWIIFNPKKQGWHDLIANTVVVRSVNDRFSSVKSDYLTDVEKF